MGKNGIFRVYGTADFSPILMMFQHNICVKRPAIDARESPMKGLRTHQKIVVGEVDKFDRENKYEQEKNQGCWSAWKNSLYRLVYSAQICN